MLKRWFSAEFCDSATVRHFQPGGCGVITCCDAVPRSFAADQVKSRSFPRLSALRRSELISIGYRGRIAGVR